ncbi:hypothetical protein MASR2M78_30960 [Treponema sp.]
MESGPLLRVLLVFPSEADVGSIRASLSASSFPVETGRANSVEDALAALASAPFDFAVSALNLSDGGASDVAYRFPMVPCIAVGPVSAQKELDACLGAGAVDYIETRSGWDKNLGAYLYRLWRIRRRLAVELGHASKRYEDLVQALPDIIYELDLEGRFSFVNRSIKILGYTSEELIGKHFSVLLFDEDVQHVSRDKILHLYDHNRTGARNAPKLFDERRGVDRKTENLELRLRRKDGSSYRGSDVIATVISYGEIASAGAYRTIGEQKDKIFVGTVGIIRDITLRRKSEDMLRKMYQAVDQSPVAVAVLDRDLVIEYVNPAFFGITGTGPEQAIGRKIGDYLGEASDKATFDDLINSVRTGIDWKGDLRCPRVASDPFWSSVLLSAIRSPSGVVTHFLCMMEDVTAKRDLDAMLKQAKNAAEEANRSKSEFLASMSHELRTPLAGVISLAELLIADKPRSDQLNRVNSIRSYASSLLNILNDLLDLSRIEARPLVLKNEDFDLQESVENLLAPFDSLASDKGLEFAFTVDDGSFPRINADLGRISQIVTNLVSNAIKFTESGSIDVKFAIRARDDMPALYVSIRDTGIGISGIDQQKLFKHYSQVENQLSKKVGGTGLGLAISKELALALGGDIWVESLPGQGSTFSFYVPVQAAGGEVIEDDSFAVAPRSLSILVAEDNPVNRDYLQFFLSKAGHNVTLASDGYEALSALEQGAFDAILMDIQMPGLDGMAAAANIRAYTGIAYDPNIPVIALTAFGIQELGEAYQKADFDAHASKPVNPRSLVALIDETVRKKERFNVERIRQQYTASSDEFRRLLLLASQDLPKRFRAFEEGIEQGDADACKTALHSVVNVLSAIGAVRALHLIKLYRKLASNNDASSALVLADLGREVEAIKQQVKKTLGEL